MKAAEEGFDGDFEYVDFRDAQMDAAVGGGGDGAEEFDRKRQAEFVQDAGELDLIAIASDVNFFEREFGGNAGVEEIADVAQIGADDSLLDEQNKGFGIIQGGIDVGVGTQHLASNPADVDAEIGTLAQHEIMRGDIGGGDGAALCSCSGVRGRCGRGVAR